MLLFAVSNDGAGPPLVYEASGSVDAATPRSQSGRKKKASRERERESGRVSANATGSVLRGDFYFGIYAPTA